MLDFRANRQWDWDASLEPIGYGSYGMESFETWWTRVSSHLQNLNPEICEQWIYRHWRHSPMKFIPIIGLGWHEEVWSPQDFMAKVKSWRSNEHDELNPDFDYKVFHQSRSNRTSAALDAGSWDYAPILLPTPGGFIDTRGEHVDADYLLVEGHQRRRYLNAILHKGRDVAPQRVLILTGWPSAS